MSERGHIWFAEVFRRGVKDLQGVSWIVRNAFDGLAFFPGWAEDSVFHINGRLAHDVVGMKRNIAGVMTVLNPANRTMMMPFGPSDPDVTVLTVDPGAGVTDGPVIWGVVRIEGGVEDAFVAGDRVSCDEVLDRVGGAGKVIILGV